MNACLLRSSVGSFVALNFIVLLRSICMASNTLLWSFGSSMPNVSSGFLKTGWRGSVSGACRMVLSASCRSRSLWISKSSSLPMRVFEFRRWRQLHSDRLSLFHVVPMMGWRISHGAPVADCWAVCFTEFSHSALSSVLRYPPPPNAHFRWNLSLVCLSVSEIYPKKESSKVKTEKMVYKKKLKPKTRKMKTMENV